MVCTRYSVSPVATKLATTSKGAACPPLVGSHSSRRRRPEPRTASNQPAQASSVPPRRSVQAFRPTTSAVACPTTRAKASLA
jgi:hypothetical protein